MPTEAKRETVAELREELAGARTLIVSEYRGLKVKEIAEIRRALRKQDVTYRVVKNRLLRIAADDSVGAALEPAARPARRRSPSATTRRGPPRPSSTRPGRTTGSSRSPAACSATGRSVPTDVTRLAALPSREVLLAKLAGGMQAPVSTLAGLFAAPLRNLGYALQQVADQKAARPTPRPPPTTITVPANPTPTKETTDMATLTQDDLLEAIDKMTVLELSEFIKRFEERYGVTAAAPVAAAAAPAAAGGGAAAAAAPRSRPSSPHPDRDRPEQDPGHQGRPRADRPRPQGGQGPGRRVPEGRQGRRHQGRGREDQGRPRGAGRQGRDQVTTAAAAAAQARVGCCARSLTHLGCARSRARGRLGLDRRSGGFSVRGRSATRRRRRPARSTPGKHVP